MPRNFFTLSFKNVDLGLLVGTVVLALFGLVTIYNASVVIAERDFGDKYHYVVDQAVWVGLGLSFMFIVSLIDYHFWKKIAFPLLLITIVSLVAVFLPGIGIKVLGASRWLNFGFFVVQPAEFAKLSLIIYLSSWFSNKEKGRFVAFLSLLGLVIGLVMLEPDMGTSVVLGSLSLVLYFLSGAPLIHFILLIPGFVATLFVLIKIAPYRLNRLLTFFDSERDPLGVSYHIRQTLFALGSGGLTGVGLGRSFQKYGYLPETTTDSIFAIIAEEFGFLGAVSIIGMYLFLVMRGFMIAKGAPDNFGKLLAAGLSSFIAIQVIINLSAQVALLPFTGIPLPLISYGGSSLIVTLVSVGILLNISRNRA